MDDSRPKALLLIGFLLLILCLVSCASREIGTTIATSINCDKKEEKDQMDDTTIPAIIERIQNLPVLLRDNTGASSAITELKKFKLNDFMSLQEGISTLDNLLSIIGEYPAIASSYGLCYHIKLEEGGELTIKVNNSGVIFEMSQTPE